MKNFWYFFCFLPLLLWNRGIVGLDQSIEKWVEESNRYEYLNSHYEKKHSIAIEIGLKKGSVAPFFHKKFRRHICVDQDLDVIKNAIQNIPQKEQSRFLFLQKMLDCRFYDKKEHPYKKNTVTWKRFLFDALTEHNKFLIQWIRVDLEGAEEWIFEDLLDTAFSKKAQLLICPHFDRWEYFHVEGYLEMLQNFDLYLDGQKLAPDLNNLRSLSGKIVLFSPKEKGSFVKKNITAVVIGYNLYTYIKKMVAQLEKYTKDIIVIDNQSFFSPLLNYYAKDFEYSLLSMKQNFGFEVYQKPFMTNLLGDVYILTDPDLEFHPNLPDHFLQELLAIQNHFDAHKVGFALKLEPEKFRKDIVVHEKGLVDWEKAFWVDRQLWPARPELEIYQAKIDTTFCLINQKIPNRLHLRVAGEFACQHLPWYKNFDLLLEPGEYESYLIRNNSSNFFKIKKRAV